MFKFLNREEAGKVLADHLMNYANKPDVIVLGLPRGGVPVANQIAKRLKAPLDVFIVRKLGVPGHSELAMGAIAMDNVTIFNQEIINSLNVSDEEIKRVIETERSELKRRELSYRGHKSFPAIKDKTVILVDDGIATGATMRAAIMALKQLQPKKMIVAVPVAEAEMHKQMLTLVDEFICPLQVKDFFAVGNWYQTFDQTTDEEVHQLLGNV